MYKYKFILIKHIAYKCKATAYTFTKKSWHRSFSVFLVLTSFPMLVFFVLLLSLTSWTARTVDIFCFTATFFVLLSFLLRFSLSFWTAIVTIITVWRWSVSPTEKWKRVEVKLNILKNLENSVYDMTSVLCIILETVWTPKGRFNPGIMLLPSATVVAER